MAVAVARKLSSSTTSLLPKLAWKSLACLAETGRGSSRCLSLDAANAPGWILDMAEATDTLQNERRSRLQKVRFCADRETGIQCMMRRQ